MRAKEVQTAGCQAGAGGCTAPPLQRQQDRLQNTVPRATARLIKRRRGGKEMMKTGEILDRMILETQRHFRKKRQ